MQMERVYMVAVNCFVFWFWEEIGEVGGAVYVHACHFNMTQGLCLKNPNCIFIQGSSFSLVYLEILQIIFIEVLELKDFSSLSSLLMYIF